MLQEIPVLLLTGYLGSGKTTLVNKILSNKRGIKFAVIVNDIGEVNIDADLIQKGGIVGKKDESLVALQNGCICCTLKMDLVEQLKEITAMHAFDYIVIEASGICEPEPIAQTICQIPTMGPQYVKDGFVRLDCIVTVVDALRMQSEFGCGNDLMKKDLEEEDIENLIIQQVEFCNMILLNKASEVSPEELDRIKKIIRALQPKAEIIECDYAEVDLDKLINTDKFVYNDVATSATWISKVEGAIEEDHDEDDDDDDHDEHHHHHHHDEEDEHEHHHHHHHDDDDDDDDDDDICPECGKEHCEEHEHHHHHHDEEEEEEHGHHHHHHHHHHHDHDGGHTEEYGIGTFVYYNRKPLDLNKFDNFVAKYWNKSIIRAKGLCYFKDEEDLCYLFEQAGKQFSLKNIGQWFATMPKEQLDNMLAQDPILRRDWDPKYGDRMQKIVFIGQKMNKKELIAALDQCLVEF